MTRELFMSILDPPHPGTLELDTQFYASLTLNLDEAKACSSRIQKG